MITGPGLGLPQSGALPLPYPSWLPLASYLPPLLYADFSTADNFWYNGAAKANKGAFLTALSANNTNPTTDANGLVLAAQDLHFPVPAGFNASAGTLLWEAQEASNTGFEAMVALLADGSNYIEMYCDSTAPGLMVCRGQATAGLQWIMSIAGTTAMHRYVCSFANGAQTFHRDGTLIGTGTGLVPAAISAFYLGSLNGTSDLFTGSFKRLGYWASKVSNPGAI